MITTNRPDKFTGLDPIITGSHSRREFLKLSATAVAATALAGELPLASHAAPVAPWTGAGRNDLLRHRFGVNYVPSKRWYYCYNDWNLSDIAGDLDRIAEIGADHIRLMVVWPWFQPNPKAVSPAHLDRLEQLVQCAGERGIDVLPCIYTGWLSGFHFNPNFYDKEPFYTSEKWAAAQALYLSELSRRMLGHPNFLGFDIGNEINCNWQASLEQGDAWMRRIFQQMHTLCPGWVHVNGVDNQPWFKLETFSAEALVAEQSIVALHCWPFWTGAGKRGQPLDPPYTQLGGGMAALARSLGRAPKKPMWMQEFGACSEEMPEADIPRWLEMTVTQAIKNGVSWFTWWASHDVSRAYEFHPFEYGLGLMTVDNRIKEQGRMFQRLAEQYRGKPVVIPEAGLPPPPAQRTHDETWRWLLEWMKWKQP